MSRKSTPSAPLHRPGVGPPAGRSTGVRRLFTPLNVVLVLLLLAGAVTAAVTELAASTAAHAPPPAVAAPVPAAPAAPAPVPAPGRMAISPPPGVTGTLADTIGAAMEGTTNGSTLPLFATTPPTPGLAPPPPGTRVPVNPVDLFSGKPTNFASPTKTYKGYVVAFCCANSAGLNGGWDGLTEAEKDTYIRSFLK